MDCSSKLSSKSEEHTSAHMNSIATGNLKHEEYHIDFGKLEEPEDLSKELKFFLIIGRFLGVLPLSGIFKKSYTQLYFHPKSFASIISMTIIATLTANLILGIWDTREKPKTNAYEIAQCIHATLQFVWSWLIYLYFLLRGKEFLLLFHYWARTNVFYGMKDRHLKRDATFITVVILASAVLENAVLHFDFVPALGGNSEEERSHLNLNSTQGESFLETVYKRLYTHWEKVIGYHPVVAAIASIQHKCMLYTINYLDVMIAVFSRAIYYRFKVLYKLSKKHLANPRRKELVASEESKTMNRHGWLQVVRDHKKLLDLFQEFEKFLSPLIFGSYATNIYYICIQLLEGITSKSTSESVSHSIYAPWSFLHIILRIYLISISAARINSYAHRIRLVLQECPSEYYNAEISRTDKKVTTGPDIGFTGLGAFVLTKPFILKIVGVIFTFEIVLLQGKPPPPLPPTTC